MTKSFGVTFTRSQFTFISHLSFTKQLVANVCKMLPDKLMKIVNCELKITFGESL